MARAPSSNPQWRPPARGLRSPDPGARQQDSGEEPGCGRFNVLQPSGGGSAPGEARGMLCGVYRGRAAVDEHGKNPRLAAVRGVCAPLTGSGRPPLARCGPAGGCRADRNRHWRLMVENLTTFFHRLVRRAKFPPDDRPPPPPVRCRRGRRGVAGRGGVAGRRGQRLSRALDLGAEPRRGGGRGRLPAGRHPPPRGPGAPAPPLARLRRLFRDLRAGAEGPLPPLLVDVLSVLQEGWGYARPLVVGSGYRTPLTNASLEGAAPASLHLRGLAADITIRGVHPEELGAAVWTLSQRLGFMGVGLYRGFVHVDVGPRRARTRPGF